MRLSEIRLPEALLDYVDSLGYATFRKKPWDMNLIAVRNLKGETNHFDDSLFLVYLDDKMNWCIRGWSVTTDPGYFWLLHPLRVEGTAIMFPGQYRRSHKIGLHKGKPALQQVEKIKVYRDDNQDCIIDKDPDSVQTGVFACNIHRAGRKSSKVEKWSAGCIVFAEEDDFEDFLRLCKKQQDAGLGDRFTLTLIELE